MQMLRPIRPVYALSSLIAGLVIAVGAWASACQVPVFRYALERWAPSPYEVTVIAEVPLTLEQESWLERLQQSQSSKLGYRVGATPSSEKQQQILSSLPAHLRSSRHLPQLLIQYPEKPGVLKSKVGSVLPLTADIAQQLQTSPARERITKSLLSGNAIVWILLESGDMEKDEQAKKVLQEELERSEKTLVLPSVDELDVKPELLEKVKVPFKIDFDVISLHRNDAREKLLVDLLIQSEEDLHEYAEEPILFPVFGRGLVLYALVGEGIESSTIREAIAFAMGPCSCQVKEQNPGFDLLLPGDWELGVGSELISQPPPDENSPPRLLKIPPGRGK